MTDQTLLLTTWMTPHEVIAWQDAIVMVYLGKVDLLEAYAETVASPSVVFPMPAVVRLRRPIAFVKKAVRFSRANVFARDGYRCQYCGERRLSSELSYDHVVPRGQGGKTSWENIVTACYPCNRQKRDRTPDQAGMRLISRPVRPRSLPMAAPRIGVRSIPREWAGYLPASG